MAQNKVICEICQFSSADITQHLKREHDLTPKEYKAKYCGDVLAKEVLDRRVKTSLERHGVPHFTNRDAIRLSYQESYEGGHPWSDSSVRAKSTQTKIDRYGDPNFVNLEKRKETNLKRYGAEHSGGNPEVIKKRLKTLKERYGKIFNTDKPSNKKELPNKETFKEDYLSGMSFLDLAKKYNASTVTLSKWIDIFELKRTMNRAKSIEKISNKEVTAKFLDCCLASGKFISFYEFGKISGKESDILRMKRLFNTKGRYHHLRETLLTLPIDKASHQTFLDGIDG